MRLRDIMTVDIVTNSARERQRTPLPASVPRPVKLTRDRMDALSLPAHVRVIGAGIGDQDGDYIARKLEMNLGKFAASVERITVRPSDANGPKGSRDQKCQVKVVLSGMSSVVVHETDSTLPQQGTGDTTFDTLGHELPILTLKIVQPTHDEPERIQRDRVFTLEQVAHRFRSRRESRSGLDRSALTAYSESPNAPTPPNASPGPIRRRTT
jgi:hypothetical protein